MTCRNDTRLSHLFLLPADLGRDQLRLPRWSQIYVRTMPESKPRRVIQVVDYDPAWADQFERLRELIWPQVSDLALAIEHVGSTSVPGLAAKPIIDLDIVIPSRAELALTTVRLRALGYRHEGNLGIVDREAFAAPAGDISHHLYVCPQDSIGLRNHLVLRDHLRANPLVAAEYGALKKDLAKAFPHDIESYIAGKSDFVLGIMARYGFGPDGK